VGVQDLVRVLRSVRCGIDIRDADIDDAVSSTGPQYADYNIPAVLALVLATWWGNWDRFWGLLQTAEEMRAFYAVEKLKEYQDECERVDPLVQ
jgi:hypothetical protein